MRRARARIGAGGRGRGLVLGLGLVLGSLFGACASFDDPDVVQDLRIVGMEATVPDQVIELDLASPPVIADVLAQLVDSTVCATVADPAADRGVAWSMTLCAFDDDGRCGEEPTVKLGAGVLADPETTRGEASDRVCATVKADAGLVGVVQAALAGDDFGGLGGIDYGVVLAVAGEEEGGGEGAEGEPQYGAKTLRIAARVPAERTANTNPTIDGITASIEDAEAVPLTLGRCADQTAPLTVAPHARVTLTPVETVGAREPYVVPTLTGESRQFVESLTYQWLAGAGGYSSGSTGGPRDFLGNTPELDTDFRAPEAEDVGAEGVDVPLWIIQRDERLGVHVYESCVHVDPE